MTYDNAKAKFPLLDFFKFDHLPPHLQVVSAPFAALRKLLEGKDAAVRSVLL
jgi:hypothetical protein